MEVLTRNAPDFDFYFSKVQDKFLNGFLMKNFLWILLISVALIKI